MTPLNKGPLTKQQLLVQSLFNKNKNSSEKITSGLETDQQLAVISGAKQSMGNVLVAGPKQDFSQHALCYRPG